MNQKTATNFVVDAVAFAAFVLLAATGLVERFLLPPGTGHFQSLWGMNRHQWGDVHFWIAVVLMGALAVHIVLHWKWIACVVRGRQTVGSGGRVALGVVGLCALVGLSIAPFLAEIEQGGPDRLDGVARQGRQDAHDDNSGRASASSAIRGSMTLAEVELATGVPAAMIVRKLGLPPDVRADARVGRLRREFGFDVDDVRRIVEEYVAEP